MNQPSRPRNWYVLHTIPRKEKSVHTALQEKDIETFLPTSKVLRQWSDRKKKIEVPLFPTYVFVKIKLDERANVLNVPGVRKIIGDRKEASIVPEIEIEAIKKIVSTPNNVSVAQCGYCPGDELVVLSGPFRGLKGKITRLNGEKRISVEITSVKQSIIIDMHPSYILTNDKIVSAESV